MFNNNVPENIPIQGFAVARKTEYPSKNKQPEIFIVKKF